MDTAANTQGLDEPGYKSDGDVDESLPAQGKGDSSTRPSRHEGQDTRMLSEKAHKRLETLSTLAGKDLKAKDLCRLMNDPSLWYQAYAHIHPNQGAATPGHAGTSLDGFSAARVQRLIEALHTGAYTPQPVKRVYIPKANGKLRPLGLPEGDDKLVQEVVRMILERLYEPVFSEASHGFRAGRSCHTALTAIQRTWTGVKWFVNVDIEGFFDGLHHDLMLEFLKKRIDDTRFLSLIRHMLTAGYYEDWKFHQTFSGAPQGGIVSPILSNIYLHEVDTKIAELAQRFNTGQRRRMTSAYASWNKKVHYYREKLGRAVANAAIHQADMLKIKLAMLERERSKTQMLDPLDSGYKRLRYCRYADDFLIGIIGSKADAMTIFAQVKDFLTEELALTVSAQKSGIVHAQQGLRYLGYDLSCGAREGRKLARTRTGKNGIPYTATQVYGTGSVTLKVPPDKAAQYVAQKGYVGPKGTAVARRSLIHRSDEEIILAYNAELRGLANYYALAVDVKFRLSWVEFMGTGSLLATLASKHGLSIQKVRRMLRSGQELLYRSNRQGKSRAIRIYRLKHLTRHVIRWDPDPLPAIHALVHSRTDIIDRLNADTCEYCGRTDGKFEVHHVRKLKDVKDKHPVQRMMAERHRKTIVLCVDCHDKLHAGRLPDLRKKSVE